MEENQFGHSFKRKQTHQTLPRSHGSSEMVSQASKSTLTGPRASRTSKRKLSRASKKSLGEDEISQATEDRLCKALISKLQSSVHSGITLEELRKPVPAPQRKKFKHKRNESSQNIQNFASFAPNSQSLVTDQDLGSSSELQRTFGVKRKSSSTEHTNGHPLSLHIQEGSSKEQVFLSSQEQEQEWVQSQGQAHPFHHRITSIMQIERNPHAISSEQSQHLSSGEINKKAKIQKLKSNSKTQRASPLKKSSLPRLKRKKSKNKNQNEPHLQSTFFVDDDDQKIPEEAQPGSFYFGSRTINSEGLTSPPASDPYYYLAQQQPLDYTHSSPQYKLSSPNHDLNQVQSPQSLERTSKFLSPSMSQKQELEISRILLNNPKIIEEYLQKNLNLSMVDSSVGRGKILRETTSKIKEELNREVKRQSSNKRSRKSATKISSPIRDYNGSLESYAAHLDSQNILDKTNMVLSSGTFQNQIGEMETSIKTNPDFQNQFYKFNQLSADFHEGQPQMNQVQQFLGEDQNFISTQSFHQVLSPLLQQYKPKNLSKYVKYPAKMGRAQQSNKENLRAYSRPQTSMTGLSLSQPRVKLADKNKNVFAQSLISESTLGRRKDTLNDTQSSHNPLKSTFPRSKRGLLIEEQKQTYIKDVEKQLRQSSLDDTKSHRSQNTHMHSFSTFRNFQTRVTPATVSAGQRTQVRRSKRRIVSAGSNCTCTCHSERDLNVFLSQPRQERNWQRVSKSSVTEHKLSCATHARNQSQESSPSAPTVSIAQTKQRRIKKEQSQSSQDESTVNRRACNCKKSRSSHVRSSMQSRHKSSLRSSIKSSQKSQKEVDFELDNQSISMDKFKRVKRSMRPTQSSIRKSKAKIERSSTPQSSRPKKRNQRSMSKSKSKSRSKKRSNKCSQCQSLISLKKSSAQSPGLTQGSKTNLQSQVSMCQIEVHQKPGPLAQTHFTEDLESSRTKAMTSFQKDVVLQYENFNQQSDLSKKAMTLSSKKGDTIRMKTHESVYVDDDDTSPKKIPVTRGFLDLIPESEPPSPQVPHQKMFLEGSVQELERIHSRIQQDSRKLNCDSSSKEMPLNSLHPSQVSLFNQKLMNQGQFPTPDKPLDQVQTTQHESISDIPQANDQDNSRYDLPFAPHDMINLQTQAHEHALREFQEIERQIGGVKTQRRNQISELLLIMKQNQHQQQILLQQLMAQEGLEVPFANNRSRSQEPPREIPPRGRSLAKMKVKSQKNLSADRVTPKVSTRVQSTKSRSKSKPKIKFNQGELEQAGRSYGKLANKLIQIQTEFLNEKSGASSLSQTHKVLPGHHIQKLSAKKINSRAFNSGKQRARNQSLFLKTNVSKTIDMLPAQMSKRIKRNLKTRQEDESPMPRSFSQALPRRDMSKVSSIRSYRKVNQDMDILHEVTDAESQVQRRPSRVRCSKSRERRDISVKDEIYKPQFIKEKQAEKATLLQAIQFQKTQKLQVGRAIHNLTTSNQLLRQKIREEKRKLKLKETKFEENQILRVGNLKDFERVFTQQQEIETLKQGLVQEIQNEKRLLADIKVINKKYNSVLSEQRKDKERLLLEIMVAKKQIQSLRGKRDQLSSDCSALYKQFKKTILSQQVNAEAPMQIQEAQIAEQKRQRDSVIEYLEQPPTMAQSVNEMDFQEQNIQLESQELQYNMTDGFIGDSAGK